MYSDFLLRVIFLRVDCLAGTAEVPVKPDETAAPPKSFEVRHLSAQLQESADGAMTAARSQQQRPWWL